MALPPISDPNHPDHLAWQAEHVNGQVAPKPAKKAPAAKKAARKRKAAAKRAPAKAAAPVEKAKAIK